jgi:hypothetical protein
VYVGLKCDALIMVVAPTLKYAHLLYAQECRVQPCSRTQAYSVQEYECVPDLCPGADYRKLSCDEIIFFEIQRELINMLSTWRDFLNSVTANEAQ